MVVGPELNATEPAVAPDGSRLAFVSKGSLYLQEEGRLSMLVSSRLVSGPAFFADGRRIGFTDGPPGQRSIRAISMSGGETQSIEQGGDSFAPVFSADGTMGAYAMSETGGCQVWVRNLSSGATWRVTGRRVQQRRSRLAQRLADSPLRERLWSRIGFVRSLQYFRQTRLLGAKRQHALIVADR